MLELKKLSGEETGVSDEFKADWEAERIDFYEDVAYGMLSLIHISEPTRLGMISYAVFCLTQKKERCVDVLNALILNNQDLKTVSYTHLRSH